MAAIDAVISAHPRAETRPVPRWSAADAWLIAYPDQFGSSGIDGIGEVVDALVPVINGVHVLPFHESSSDGGFSVLDFAKVDPEVGDWSAIGRLAGRHRLMADAVINHLSAQGPWFRGDLAGDPASADFFRRVDPATDFSAVVRPRPGRPVTTFTAADGSDASVWTTFSADQVDLDYRTPAVLVAVIGAVLRYIAHGAVVIRLDAVAFLWKDPATASIHQPQTHAIVALLRDVLHQVDPGVIVVTETNVAHSDNIAYFGSPETPEAHAVYQFTLAPLVLHAVTTGDAEPLRTWAATIDAANDTTFLNFLASHDGVGVRPAKGWLSEEQVEALAAHCRACGGGVNRAETATGTEPYELTATWRSLMEGPAGSADPDTVVARHLAAHAVALALPGLPLLYTHSLVGSPNDRAGADASGVARDVNRARFESPESFLRAIGDVDAPSGRIWAGLQVMLEHRRSTRAFDPDAPHRILASEGSSLVVERGWDEGPRFVVLINLGAAPVTVDLGDALARGSLFDAQRRRVTTHVTLDAWSQIWLTGD